MLQHKNILIVSPESWTHLFLSKHHYAVTLASLGNQVFFLNPPSGREALKHTEYDNLQVVDYKGFVPGLRFFPKIIRKLAQRRVFNQIQKRIGLPIDVVWSFDNSVFFDLDCLPTRVISISHIVDLNQDFHFDRAAGSAHICFCSTEHILTKAKRVNPKSYFINHGYDNQVSRGTFSVGTSQSLKVGYAGSLDMVYIDWDIIEQVVKKHRQITFYFAGKTHQFRLENEENATYVGKLSKPELFDFYDQMDLLILAYKADEYKEQLANPHKMMEYLGTGKPIVATHTHHYSEFSDLIAMSSTNDRWSQVFSEVVDNFDFWSEDSRNRKRRNIALENTYQKQVERIGSLIAKL
ncbi:MAG: glycosyltransferase [Cytophagales bacterium]|nr:glycosyltransferase [Cytophagales bacterium]